MIPRPLRRLGFGLATLSGVSKRGFFIPYRHADQIPASAERGPYWALAPLFSAAEPHFQDLLVRMETYADALMAIGHEKAPEPRWNQDWFPRLDGCAAYVLVRELSPARIIEVGSGHSTRFLARAARDAGIDIEITSIDPKPRAAIEGLGVRIHRQTAQDAGPPEFEKLEAGDILFIDSSHILMPGTDVDFLFNHILPLLPAGVFVHIHDIFLPDGYPQEWEWRGYNEQLGVAALLQGGAYRLLWASHYVVENMAGTVDAGIAGRLELMPGAHEASLWLEKL